MWLKPDRLDQWNRSPQDVTERIDRLIAEIRTKWHAPVMKGSGSEKTTPGDVLIVAHGHILRAFAMRWVGKALHDGPAFLLEAGGVGTLRYVFRAVESPVSMLLLRGVSPPSCMAGACLRKCQMQDQRTALTSMSYV